MNHPSEGGTYIRKAGGTLEKVTTATGERACRCRDDHVSDEVANVAQQSTPVPDVVDEPAAVTPPWMQATSTPQE